jgi:hypothetical protein
MAEDEAENWCRCTSLAGTLWEINWERRGMMASKYDGGDAAACFVVFR